MAALVGGADFAPPATSAPTTYTLTTLSSADRAQQTQYQAVTSNRDMTASRNPRAPPAKRGPSPRAAGSRTWAIPSTLRQQFLWWGRRQRGV